MKNFEESKIDLTDVITGGTIHVTNQGCPDTDYWDDVNQILSWKDSNQQGCD